MKRLAPLFLLLIITASGCGLFPEKEDETKGWSVTKLYTEAKDLLADGDYPGAVQLYDILLGRYPFGKYAQQAYLEKAYAHYRDQEPDSAIATLDRFIKVYPKHPHVDYAYYLKGLINYNRGQTIFTKYVPVDHSERDPGAARDSFEDFGALLRRFPNSKYYEDARLRMTHLRNSLARYEIHVAEWYMRRHAYLAAANRGKYVLEHYQRSPYKEQALQYMIMAYEKLDMADLRSDAVRVLKLNFPESEPKTYVHEEPS
ncbi:MAG: outer membrane protein assembly factor BamD, partial [Gammaproteobacteria bacterium]